MTLAIDGAASVEHRIETLDGTTIDQLRVLGAVQTGDLRIIGRTRSLIVTPSPSAYTISYEVQQSRDRASRCPIWLPTTPADGVSRAVKLQVELPPGMTPGSTMPRFVWTGSSGEVTLAHLPAFVLLPFAPAAEQPGWDVAAAMDVAAAVTFVSASAIWVWRRRRGR